MDGLVSLYIAIVIAIRRKAGRILFSYVNDPVPILCALHQVKRFLCPENWTIGNPYKIIWVNPKKIKRVSSLHHPLKHGEVREGDWDLNNKYFTNKTVFKSIKEYINKDSNLDDTELHRLFNKQTKGGSAWGYYSTSNWKDRKSEIEELVSEIRSEGYRTQRYLANNSNNQIHKQNNDSIHPYLNEIKVDIGRDGELLWRHSGQHRLAIAKQCEIERVAVLVVTRHRHWEIKRRELVDNIEENTHIDMENLSHHPDLDAILQTRSSDKDY